jgi:hypothetical protein
MHDEAETIIAGPVTRATGACRATLVIRRFDGGKVGS